MPLPKGEKKVSAYTGKTCLQKLIFLLCCDLIGNYGA